MSMFLVLYRGGDATKLSPKDTATLEKKWERYMAKLRTAGALRDGAAVDSAAATQVVGKAKAIKDKRVGNHASFVGGYCLLEGKNMKAIQTLSKTCPHVTFMDGTIEILPVVDTAQATP